MYMCIIARLFCNWRVRLPLRKRLFLAVDPILLAVKGLILVKSQSRTAMQLK